MILFLAVLFVIRSSNSNIIVSGNPVSYIILNWIISSLWFYLFCSHLCRHWVFVSFFSDRSFFLLWFDLAGCSTLAQSTGLLLLLFVVILMDHIVCVENNEAIESQSTEVFKHIDLMGIKPNK